MKKITAYLQRARHTLYAAAPQFIPIGNGGQPGTQGEFNTKLFGQGADLSTILTTAFQMALSVGAILAVLRIAYAGYLYMGQADMWSTKGHAKEVFRNAIIGLLLLFGMWLILNQINPDILQLDIFRCLKGSCPGATGSR
jgi:hypothetical protein